MASDPGELTATELLRRYRSRALSPVEVAEAGLARIRATDERLNAWCFVDEATTLALARASEARWQHGEPRGALDGVPVAIKDVFLTRGWPTLKGSRTVDRVGPWEEDAPAVAALLRHGAVPLGKTTTPEFGWKGVTDSPLCGVTTNPWQSDRTAGGSSGGSAVAVATGAVPLALGTDAGGSIRIPAGFCGIVGLKPSRGDVPHWPPPPYGALAHAGPMSWTVEDCARLQNVLVEPDPRDPNAGRRPGIDYTRELERGVAGLRIAYSATLGTAQVDPEIAELVSRAVAALEELGARVEACDPDFESPLASFETLFYAGAFNAVRGLPEAARRELDPGLERVARGAAHFSLADYLDAVAAQNQLTIRMNRFFESYDLLVTPTLPIPAFEGGCEVPPDWPEPRWPCWTPFTYPFNMTGQPALSVPCGFTSEGLPAGLQIVGPRFADARVLQAGYAFQQARPWMATRPALGSS